MLVTLVLYILSASRAPPAPLLSLHQSCSCDVSVTDPVLLLPYLPCMLLAVHHVYNALFALWNLGCLISAVGSVTVTVLHHCITPFRGDHQLSWARANRRSPWGETPLWAACRLARLKLLPAAQTPQGCVEHDGIPCSSSLMAYALLVATTPYSRYAPPRTPDGFTRNEWQRTGSLPDKTRYIS